MRRNTLLRHISIFLIFFCSFKLWATDYTYNGTWDPSEPTWSNILVTDTVTFNADFNNNEPFEINGTIVIASGKTVRLQGTSTFGSTATIKNSGSLTFDLSLTLPSGTTVFNFTGATFTTSNGITNAGTFNNYGELISPNGLTNSGTINNTGSLSITNTINNTGTLTSSGSITTTTNFTNTGSVTNTGTVNANGGVSNTGTGSFDNTNGIIIGATSGETPITGNVTNTYVFTGSSGNEWFTGGNWNGGNPPLTDGTASVKILLQADIHVTDGTGDDHNLNFFSNGNNNEITIYLNGHSINCDRLIQLNGSDAVLKIQGPGSVVAYGIDSDNNTKNTLELSSGVEFTVTSSLYGNLDSPGAEFNIKGDGTCLLYLPASGANVNYGPNKISYTNITRKPKGSPSVYSISSDNSPPASTDGLKITLTRTGAGGESPASKYKVELINSDGITWTVNGNTLEDTNGLYTQTCNFPNAAGSADIVIKSSDALPAGSGIILTFLTPDSTEGTGISATPMELAEIRYVQDEVKWKGLSEGWTDQNNWDGITSIADLATAPQLIIPSGCANYPTISGTQTVKSLLIKNGAHVTVTGTLTVNNKIECSGTGYIDSSSGTIDFSTTDSSETSTWTATYPEQSKFGALVVSSGTFTPNSDLYILNSLTTSGGKYDAKTNSITTYIQPVSNATIENSSGTIEIQTLDCTNQGGKTLTINGNSNVSTLRLSGNSGTSFLIVTGTGSITLPSNQSGGEFLDITNASVPTIAGSKTYTITNSLTPASLPTGWIVGDPATYTWQGTSTVWSTGSNWSSGLIPGSGATVVIPAGCSNYPVLTEDLELGTGTVVIEENAYLNLNGWNLTAEEFTLEGTLISHGNETIIATNKTFGNNYTLEYNSTGSSINTALFGTTIPNIVITSTGSLSTSNAITVTTLKNNGTLTMNAALTAATVTNNSTIAAEANTLTINTSYSGTSDTISAAAGGSIIYSGSAATFTNISLDGAAFTNNTAATTITNLTLSANESTIDGTASVTIDTALDGGKLKTENSVTLNGNLDSLNIASVTTSLSGTLSSTDVTIGTTGTLNANDNDITVSGDWNNNNPSGGFNTGTTGNTVNFTGTDKQITGTNTFHDVTVTGKSTFTGSNQFNDVTISAETTFSAGNTFNDVTVNAQTTFSTDNSFHDVTINADATFGGSNSFNSITCTSAGGKTLTFTGGTTTTVTSELTLTGTSTESLLKLAQPGTGNWSLNTTGATTTLNFLQVEKATSTVELTAPNSEDLGSNNNWIFPDQTYTWEGSDATDNTDWTKPANWSPASVPGNGSDIVIGNGTSIPKLPASVSIDNLTINSGKTLDLNNNNLTCNTLKINGTLSFAGSETITKSDSTKTDLDTNSTGYTLEFYGTTTLSNQTLFGSSIPNIVITSTGNLSTNADLVVTTLTNDGELTTAATLDVTTLTNDGTLTLGGNLTYNGTTALALGTVSLSNDVTLTHSGTDATATITALTINGGKKFTNLGNATTITSLTLSGTSATEVATLDATSAEIFVTDNISNGYMKIISSSTTKVSLKGSLNSLEIDTSSKVSLTGDSSFTDFINNGEIDIANRSFTITNSYTPNSSQLDKISTNGGNIINSSTTTILEISNLSTGTSVSTLTGGEKGITITKPISGSTGNLKTSGIISLNGTLNQLEVTDGTTTLSANSTITTLTSNGTTSLSGTLSSTDVTIDTAGTFNANDNDITVSGNWNNNNPSGGFNAGTTGNTVNFTGTDKQITGTNTFHDVTFTAGATFNGSNTFNSFICETQDTNFTFADGTETTITTELTLNGTEDHPIILKSGTPGTQWKIESNGTNTLSYLNVQDSNNTSTSALTAEHSTDSGNNTNWNFLNQEYKWISSTNANNSNWFESTNWNPASIPGVGTKVTIETVDTNTKAYPILENNISLTATSPSTSELIIASGAQIDLNGKSVSVNKLTNNGRIKAQGTETVTLSENTTKTNINQTGSTVEYYGTFTAGTAPCLGLSYNNIEFTGSAQGEIDSTLEVSGTTLILTSGTLNLSSSENNFTGNITIGDSTTPTYAGTITINGVSGTTPNLLKISANAYATALTFNSPVQLNGNVTTTGNQQYDSTVQTATSASNISAGTSGNITFADTLSLGNDLSVTADTITLSNNILVPSGTTPALEFTGAVKLADSLSIAASTVTFNTSLTSSDLADKKSLEITGNATFGSSISDISGLARITFTSAAPQTVTSQNTTSLNLGTVTFSNSSTDGLSLSGTDFSAATLTNNGTLTLGAGTSAASITNNGPLTMNAALTAATVTNNSTIAAGAKTLKITNSYSGTSDTISADGGSIIYSGSAATFTNISLDGAAFTNNTAATTITNLTLSANESTIDGTASVTIDTALTEGKLKTENSVTLNGTLNSLNVASGTTTLSGSLTITETGDSLTIANGSTLVAGTQSTDAFTITTNGNWQNQNTTGGFTAQNSTVSFEKPTTVSGTNTFHDVTFNDTVTLLQSNQFNDVTFKNTLTLSDTNIFNNVTFLSYAAGNITTQQTINGKTTIKNNGDKVLTLSNENNNFALGITIGAIGDETTSHKSGSITLNGKSGANALTLDANAYTTALTFNSPVQLNGNVTTTGNQQYDSTVQTATSASAISAGTSGNITFADTLSLGNDLSVTAAAINFKNDLLDGSDGITPTHNLTITGVTTLTPTADTLKVNTKSVTFDGTLAGATNSVNLTLAGTTATFENTVNSLHAFSAAGNVTFNGSVGETTPLYSIDVTGTTIINAEKINTTSTQTYTNAVIIKSDTTITASELTFNSTVDADTDNSHTVTFNAQTKLNGSVGATHKLNNITFANTTTTISAISINAAGTTGNITFADTLSLGNDLSVTADTINFKNNLLDGSDGVTPTHNLTIKGATTLTPTSGTLKVNTKSVTFDGTLAGATNSVNLTLAGTTATFENPVNSLHAFSAAGNVTFNGSVGETTPLYSIDITGTTIFDKNATVVTTANAQNYNDAVEIKPISQFTATAASQTYTGNVTIATNTTFANALDGTPATIIFKQNLTAAPEKPALFFKNANLTFGDSYTNDAFTGFASVTYTNNLTDLTLDASNTKIDVLTLWTFNGSTAGKTFFIPGNDETALDDNVYNKVEINLPNGTLDFASHDFTQTPDKNFTITSGNVTTGNGIFKVGNLIVEAEGIFTQTLNNDTALPSPKEQSVSSIINNGQITWDSSSTGGSLIVNGTIEGDNYTQIAYNKKNVSINSSIGLSGIFWDLIIKAGNTVSNNNDFGLRIRRNFTIEDTGVYSHNDKPLVFGNATNPDDSTLPTATTAEGSGKITDSNATPNNLGNVTVNAAEITKTATTPLLFTTLQITSGTVFDTNTQQITTTSDLTNNGHFINDANVFIAGNFVDTDGTWESPNNSNCITFNGSGTQTIAVNQTVPTLYPSVIINKNAGTVTVNTKINATNFAISSCPAITFNEKVTFNTLTNSATSGNITFLNGGTVTNGGATTDPIVFNTNGTLTFHDDPTDAFDFTNPVQHTTGPTIVQGTLNANALSFDHTTLAHNTTINTTNDITFTNDILGADYTLLLNSAKNITIKNTNVTTLTFQDSSSPTAQESSAKIFINGEITTGTTLTFPFSTSLMGASVITCPNIIFPSYITLNLNNYTLDITAYALFNATLNSTGISAESNSNVTVHGDVIMNNERDNIISINAPLTCDNLIVYSGHLITSANITTLKDLVFFGTAYNEKDNQTEIEKIFVYKNGNFAAPQGLLPDGNPTPVITELPTAAQTVYGAALTTNGEITIKAGENFFANGLIAASNADWHLLLKSNKNTSQNFAYAFYCDFTNSACKVGCTNPEAPEDAVCISADSCTVKQDYEAGWDLSDFEIADAYTVHDNIVCIKFNRPVRNLFSVLNSPNTERILNSNGKYLNFYSDIACTIPLAADSETDTVYLVSNVLWNTDAIGTDYGRETSTDTFGVHQTVKPYLEIKRNTGTNFEAGEYDSFVTDLYGKRLNHYSASGTGSIYTSVHDKCSPVMVTVKTGQELHSVYDNTVGESSQHSYDSHNFIEFSYSEAVNFGSQDTSVCDIWIPALNADNAPNVTENVRVTPSFGALAGDVTVEGMLEFAGLGSLENGKIHTGSNGNVDKTVNALYRATEYSIRLSIAGWTDGTIADREGYEFKNWKGYIESAVMPTGVYNINQSSGLNALVTDIDGNAQKSASVEIRVNSAENELYGAWDISEPIFALCRLSLTSPWGRKQFAEAVGTGSGSSLDRIEFHFFDNKPTFTADDPAAWFTQKGWCINDDTIDPTLYDRSYSYCADIVGGARQFESDAARRTTGGIRFSTTAVIPQAFKYSKEGKPNPDTPFVNNISGVYSTASSSIFFGSSSPRRSNDDPDGLYFGLGLSESGLPIETTFTVSYDESVGYLTDLAGNRMRSDIVSTIDRTPPSFDLCLSPINQDEIFAIFVKELVTDSANLQYRNQNGDNIHISESFEELMPYCFDIIKIDSNGIPSLADIQIDTSRPAQVQVYNPTADEDIFGKTTFTFLRLKLTRNLTLADIENLHLRLRYPSMYTETSLDPVTSIRDARVTFIQDAMGNYMQMYTAHALSDFVIGAVNPMYAYDEDMSYGDETIMNGMYEEGSWAVHDWEVEQQNYGTLPQGHPIGLAVDLDDGTESEQNLPQNLRVFLSAEPDVESIATQFNSDFMQESRVWLPSVTDGIFPGFALSNNTNYDQVDSALLSSELSDGLIFHISKEIASKWNSGDQISFLFGLLNNDNSQMRIYNNPFFNVSTNTYEFAKSSTVPLYSLRLHNPDDVLSLELWSFKVRATTEQRAGVTILNNVINSNLGEKAVVKVDMPSDGKLNVIVMTLDGNIVQYLAHGSTTGGEHYYSWNGKNKNGNPVARGMYFIRVVGNGIDETRKVMVVK